MQLVGILDKIDNRNEEKKLCINKEFATETLDLQKYSFVKWSCAWF